MDLRCNPKLASNYKSAAQVARVVTEAWATANLFCAACSSDNLARALANTRACDLSCPDCAERYELKSMRRWSDYRVLDSGYHAMIRAIRGDATPNLLLMHRSDSWYVERLLLIPRFFLAESIIERRKALAITARRAGWVGCNILIGEIPADGRISIIENRVCVPRKTVRASYERVSPLKELPTALRSWALDVLRCVRQLPRRFELSDVYKFESDLRRLHPDNRHVKDKIRQQLQVLRDAKLVRFVGSGRYESS